MYTRIDRGSENIENGHVPHSYNKMVDDSHRKHRKSRCTSCRWCGKGGGLFCAFFIGMKLLGAIAVFIIGKEYLPVSFFHKIGLCDVQVTVAPPGPPVPCIKTDRLFQNTPPTLNSNPPNAEPSVKELNLDVKNELTTQDVKSAQSELLTNLPGIKSDSTELYRPRIMCLIFTTIGGWKEKARAVNDTWAKRCDVHRFYYSSMNGEAQIPSADAIPLGVPEGRDHLTAKTMRAFRAAYFDHQNTIDWFLKADDDTYIIMENLRLLLSTFNPNNPHYVGGRSLDLLAHGYNGGGAGYVLSRAAVRLTVEEGYKFPKGCKQDGGVEDLDMGFCLEQFQVYPEDTKDSMNRLTFHPDHPYKIFANLGDNRRVYTYNKTGSVHGFPAGIRVMSPHMISFHYMEPGHMYMYDFLLYDLKRSQDLIHPDTTGQQKPHR